MNNDMPIKTEWNTTGYVQSGDSHLPIDRIEFTPTPFTPINKSRFSSFQEQVKAAKFWHTKIELEVTEETRNSYDIFCRFVRGTFITSAYYPLSKQTNAYYRIRARDWDRQKVVVHAHKRKHRGRAR